MKKLAVVPPPQPNPDVLATVEAILADAKAGKIRSFAFAATMTGGESVSGCCYDDWVVGLLAELEIAKARVIDHLRELNGSL